MPVGTSNLSNSDKLLLRDLVVAHHFKTVFLKSDVELMEQAMKSQDIRMRCGAIMASRKYEDKYLLNWIEDLMNPNFFVREASRENLIFLSYKMTRSKKKPSNGKLKYVDFGPFIDSTPIQCAESSIMWKRWFELQNEDSFLEKK